MSVDGKDYSSARAVSGSLGKKPSASPPARSAGAPPSTDAATAGAESTRPSATAPQPPGTDRPRPHSGSALGTSADTEEGSSLWHEGARAGVGHAAGKDTTAPAGTEDDGEPHSKGKIVNTVIGSVASAFGGSVAGAVGETAKSVAGEAAKDAVSDMAKDAVKDTAKPSVKNVAKEALKDGTQKTSADVIEQYRQDKEAKKSGKPKDTWMGLGKEVGSSLKDAVTSTGASNVLSDDDRTRATKARDNLKNRTGIDVDEAVGAAAGGAATVAAAATGVGAAAAPAIGAAAGSLATGMSRAQHEVTTTLTKARKTITLALATVVAVLLLFITSLVSGSAAQKLEEERAYMAAYQAAAMAEQSVAETAAISCSVDQEYPMGHVFGPDHVVTAKAIDAVGMEQGVPTYGIVVAVAVAIANTKLQADFDSDGKYGVFGFRPADLDDSQDVESLRDVATSSRIFFERLAEMEEWEVSPLDHIANTVMGSAYVNGFAPYEATARAALVQSGKSQAGAGCEPIGTALACDPGQLEADMGALTPDARNLLRCLERLQHVGAAKANSVGTSLTVTFGDDFDLDEALSDPSSPTEPASEKSGKNIASWVSAVYETFGVKSISAYGQTAEFKKRADISAEEVAADDPDSVTHYRLWGERVVPGDGETELVITVHGSAGTGVVSKRFSSGQWVMPAVLGCASDEMRMRNPHPITGKPKMHWGIDFGLRTGTPLYAVADGQVRSTTYSSGGGYMIFLTHADGIETRYMHLSKFSVKEGDQVLAGDTIGLSGNTGGSTGPHLHFEVLRNGSYENPRHFMEGVGVPLPAKC